MYILRFVSVFCTDYEFCSLVKLKKKAAMEITFFREKKKLSSWKKNCLEISKRL